MCLTVVKNIKFLQNANSYECGMSKGSFFSGRAYGLIIYFLNIFRRHSLIKKRYRE